MNPVVISINDISKLYRLGEVGTGMLADEIKHLWCRLLGKSNSDDEIGVLNDRTQIGGSDYVWAIKDINFDIRAGETLGIIGKNGAGKSTLLKILSRITTPTTGQIKVKGRMGSLLEVGTGMHPEMTARENIYLNGAILGMKENEITRKFDDIISFSGCAKYVDTPIKRYSSGMRVRLGFSVAAFLEAEILIVDEVLAVGDLEFQQKAAGKMREVSSSGDRTVIFVSHNLEALSHICDRGIILDMGRIIYDGDAGTAVNKYRSSIFENIDTEFDYSHKRDGTGNIRVYKFSIENQDDNQLKHFPIGAKLRFRIFYSCTESVNNLRIVIGIRDMLTAGIIRFDTNITKSEITGEYNGDGEFICETDSINLKPDKYFVNVTIFSNGVIQDQLSRVAIFEIRSSNYFDTGKIFDASIPAKLLVKHEWKVLN